MLTHTTHRWYNTQTQERKHTQQHANFTHVHRVLYLCPENEPLDLHSEHLQYVELPWLYCSPEWTNASRKNTMLIQSTLNQSVSQPSVSAQTQETSVCVPGEFWEGEGTYCPHGYDPFVVSFLVAHVCSSVIMRDVGSEVGHTLWRYPWDSRKLVLLLKHGCKYLCHLRPSGCGSLGKPSADR